MPENAGVLKDGSTVQDPRLDRLAEFDEKSREYGVRELLMEAGETRPRSKSWVCPLWNDQGREGACVGFAWSHELAADPLRILANEMTAMAIYKKAQFIDEWPGEAYSGTSVLAGAKVVQTFKSNNKLVMPEYRWAFGVDDLMLAVAYQGPAVLGLNWYQGMFNTDPTHFIRVSGSLRGGHCILARGIRIFWKAGTTDRTTAEVDREKSYFTLRNSWGKDWGRNGDCRITVADLERLLNESGDACIPVVRRVA